MKKIIQFTLALLCSLCFSLLAFAQCGTQFTPQDIEKLNKYRDSISSLVRDWKRTRGVRDVPIKFHVAGENSVSLWLIDEQVKILNHIYINANLRFIRYDEPNYINDDRFNDYQIYMEDDLALTHEIPNVINVFYVDDIPGYAGYTYMAGNYRSNRVFISKKYMENKSTLAHEVGHFFGLYHTHGKTNDAPTDEYVSRIRDADNDNKKDCLTTGDDCCDTPADPNLKTHKGYCNSNCTINNSPSRVDPNGDYYKPMVRNLMSYNPYKNCRDTLTVEQLMRVSMIAKNERASLKIPDEDLRTGKKVAGRVVFTMTNQDPMPVTKDINLYRFDKLYKWGDSFTFSATNNSDISLNMYIINWGTSGTMNLLYPVKRYGEEADIKTDATYSFPQNFKLTGKPGKDYVCFLFSRKKLNEVKLTQYLQDAEGNFTQRLYSVIGENSVFDLKLLPFDEVDYREGNTINFSGFLEEDEILPVMVEMEWQQ